MNDFRIHMTQYEREEEQLERDLHNGLISQKEYNREMQEMQRAYRAEMRELAENAAERAYCARRMNELF